MAGKTRDPHSDEAPLSTRSTSLEGTTRAAAPKQVLEVGARLGHFRVEARLGEGGLGIVYRAYDDKLRREVALKVLAEASSVQGTSLLEEARAAASLMHPSIAAIHEVRQHDGVAFIVMELVQGSPLRVRLQRGPIEWRTAIRYARDIAAGLARAHKSGVVHRDLKPENVMITPEGGAKILDFGLARAAPEQPPSSRIGGIDAQTGIAGTPDYMAPEQARGRRVDARADVFSFGVVLYEMFSGKRPFAKRGARRLEGSPEDEWRVVMPLAQAAPDVPRELVGVVERCLAVERGARYADGDEVLRALSAAEAAAAEKSAPLGARRSRSAVVWGGIALLAAASLVAVIAYVRVHVGAGGGQTGARPPAPPPDADFALTSAPAPITSAGLCSTTPVFAGDGSIVFARSDAAHTEIVRLDTATNRETVLTHDGQRSSRPAPGAPGEIVYWFEKKGDDNGTLVRSVPLEGGEPRTLARGTDPVVAAGSLFFLQADVSAVRRSRLDGTHDEVLFEAPPSSLFAGLAVSPDGRWLVTSETGLVWRFVNPLCVAALDGPQPVLDCTSAGVTTSRRVAFSPTGKAIYFTRGDSIVRFDLAARTSTQASVTPTPTSLTISPDGTGVVYSTCRTLYQALRLSPDGAATSLPAVVDEIGLLQVGPRGQLAFPVARGTQAALGITDEAGTEVRLMTSPDQFVTESVFSPDGTRVAYHDTTPITGGLFVIDVDGTHAPTRITRDPDDSLPSWVDRDHVVYAHPENGFPHGRAYVVPAAGGEPRALPTLPGMLFGAVPARGTLLLAIHSPAGDRFVEATLEGRMRDLVLRGASKGMHWDVSIAASASGRYVTWFESGVAWKADIESGKVSRVDFAWPIGYPNAIQADDDGRVTVSFRHADGQLYRASGRFP